MFLEVEYDHYESVSAALKLSICSNICDKICLVSESGDKFCTSFSFISLFSKLISSITKSIHEDIPLLIFVPLKLVTIENLMLLLSEGKFISNDIESLTDVFEAAKTFGIESQSWSIEIEEKEILDATVPAPVSDNCESVLVKSISEPLPNHGFSDLDWADCEIENKTNDSDIEVNEPVVRNEVEEINKNSGQKLYNNCQVDILNVSSKVASGEVDFCNQEAPDDSKTEQMGPRKRGRPKKTENTGPVLCPECPRSFMVPSHLNVHYASSHTGENSFNCAKCKKRFKSKYSLQYHVISFHEEPTEVNDSCNVCGDIIVGLGKTEYISRLSAKLKMKNHMQIFHEDKKEVLLCFICNKKFIMKKQFAKHMLRAHPKTARIVKKEPIPCSHPGCDRKFVHDSSRHLHEKSHDPDAFKFACQFCDLKFVYRSILHRHQEFHNPWRKCEDCGEKLQSKRAFDIHNQRCRNDFKFCCELCNKKFVEKDKLDRHLVVHTTRKTLFSCDNCDKKFVRKDGLQEHMRLRRQSCEKRRVRRSHEKTSL